MLQFLKFSPWSLNLTWLSMSRSHDDVLLNLLSVSSVSSDQPDGQSWLRHQLGNAELVAEYPRRLLHRYDDWYPRPRCFLFLQHHDLLGKAGVRTPVLSGCDCFECNVQQQRGSIFNVWLRWATPASSRKPFFFKLKPSDCIHPTLPFCPTAPCLPDGVVANLDCRLNTFAVQWNGSVGGLDSYTALAIGSDGARATCNTSDTNCIIQNLKCGLSYNIVVTTSSVNCGTIEGSDYSMQSGRRSFFV